MEEHVWRRHQHHRPVHTVEECAVHRHWRSPCASADTIDRRSVDIASSGYVRRGRGRQLRADPAAEDRRYLGAGQHSVEPAAVADESRRTEEESRRTDLVLRGAAAANAIGGNTNAGHDPDGGGGVRPVGGLCQPGRPGLGAGRPQRSRDCDSAGAWGDKVGHPPSVLDGEPAAHDRGRYCRPDGGWADLGGHEPAHSGEVPAPRRGLRGCACLVVHRC